MAGLVKEAEEERAGWANLLLRRARVRMRYERMAASIIDTMAEEMRQAHGDPSQGKLTYREIADIVGLSRARVIQIVTGRE